MRMPTGYNEAAAQRPGEFQGIEPGNYCGVILNAAEGETQNGSPFIEFAVDILDGKYARYYQKDYNAQKPIDGVKKWRGTVRYFTTEKALGMLKGAFESIEESNPGYKWDWNEATLKGKKVGLRIRREQYEASDHTLKFATKPYAFCAIQKVISGEMPEPADRLLDTSKIGTGRGYTSPNLTPPGYQTPGPAPAQTEAPKWEELTSEDELPF